MVPCTPPVCWKRSANCALRTFIGQEDAKVRQFSGAPFAPLADAMTRNPSWSEPTLCTLNGTPLDVSPVVLFFNVTVNEPAARISCPETCVLLPPAPMLHGELHPGPLKNTVLFDVSKFCPVSVTVNPCPLTGGLGEVEMLEIDEGRSEERRVGKECRSRWSPYDSRK